MSESNKSTEDPEPQPAKPESPPLRERNLRTGWTYVGDSAEVLREKDK